MEIDNTEGTLRERTKAYLAGIIDGEGSFCIYHHLQDGYQHYISQLRAYGTDKRLMKWIVKHFGGTYFKVREAEGTYKAEWAWQHSGQKHGATILSYIQPYLKIKREQGEVMAEYFSLVGQKCPEKRLALETRMKFLNDRLKGRSPLTTDTFDFPVKTNLINAYFGGILDGEGGLYIAKDKKSWGYHYYSKITATNYQMPLLNSMKKFYGGSINPPYSDLVINNHAAQEKILLKLLPYLVIKREQAGAILEFTRLHGQENPVERERLYKLVKKLNGKMIQSELTSDSESDLAEMQKS